MRAIVLFWLPLWSIFRYFSPGLLAPCSRQLVLWALSRAMLAELLESAGLGSTAGWVTGQRASGRISDNRTRAVS